MTGRLGIDDVTPAVGDGRHPAKAVVGEVIPIGATVWREGHDAVAANVVWRRVGSRGAAHHVRMEQTGLGTDRFEAVVAADEPGLWTFRVDAWSDPWATWRNAVTKKLDAGQSPEELANDLETGARLLQRVGRRPAERPNRDLLFGAANALRDTALPLHARVRARAVPGRAHDHDGAPGPGADHPRPLAAGLRRPRARPVRLLVRVLPALHRRARRDRPRGARHVRHRGQGARPGRGDGLRRGLPAPDPPRRHRAPQGPQQLRARRAGRRRLAVGDRLGRGRARRDRPRAGHDGGLRRVRRSARTTSAWRSRSTSRCSARPTTRGSRSTRSGSPCAPTARSPTRRTRRRSTRTSTRSTSTTTPRASTTSRCGSCCSGSSTACGSSGWTTRTPSRRTSGTG